MQLDAIARETFNFIEAIRNTKTEHSCMHSHAATALMASVPDVELEAVFYGLHLMYVAAGGLSESGLETPGMHGMMHMLLACTERMVARDAKAAAVAEDFDFRSVKEIGVVHEYER